MKSIFIVGNTRTSTPVSVGLDITATEVTNSWCFGCTAPGTTLSAPPNSRKDANSNFATGNTAAGAWNTLGVSPAAGSEQKRTHTLSNDAVIWDFSGSLWHWVSDIYSSLGLSSAIAGA
jgi:hypothetical protein